ncbi:hypothetical protein ABZX66_29870, partial [Micromonospora aurantiaca]|uniref:hypothetical protein n=1 Tax=Micromonospora aurantiaca (nom. illeg.) TaxID=47850 RepID=UPI0033A98A30
MPKLDPIERAENYLALAQDSDTAPDKAQALRWERQPRPAHPSAGPVAGPSATTPAAHRQR